ncbi:MAG: ABC transporter ATP-binding protein [Deltaproteobacteria bacterium]|nr:ABC transporter ATP-binding protein [Deltaproteobacteria bacterium]
MTIERHGAKIDISNLVKKFNKVLAVDHVSLHIEPGEFVTLLGPSGSGKSTILKIVAGFERPTEGEVYINDEPMVNKPSYSRNIGMVFQNYVLFPHMTVFENISFPLRMRKMNKMEMKERVTMALELVKLPGLENRYPKQLSGGQQQRIALARCLVFDPSVILMDEPLGALDKNLREHMQLELKRISKKLKMTVVYVTHDQSEALNMSDMIVVLKEGRIKQLGSPMDLYENPENSFVADFIGESNFIKGTITSCCGEISVFKTDFNQELKAPQNHRYPEKMEVMMAIHPEKIKIIGAKDENLNIIKGRITEVIYLGAITKYYIVIENGQTIFITHINRSDTPLHPVNDDVMIGWSVNDCKLTC